MVKHNKAKRKKQKNDNDSIVKVVIKQIPLLDSPFRPQLIERDVFWPHLQNQVQITQLPSVPYLKLIEQNAKNVLSQVQVSVPRVPRLQSDDYRSVLEKVKNRAPQAQVGDLGSENAS